jgi:hypothetical protein
VGTGFASDRAQTIKEAHDLIAKPLTLWRIMRELRQIRASNPDVPPAHAGRFCSREHAAFAGPDDADHGVIGRRCDAERFARPQDRAIDGVRLAAACASLSDGG